MAPVNKPTRLLSQEVNNRFFIQFLEPKCATLVTTIAALHYYIDNAWVVQWNGILCFERDSNTRGYYLRLYSLINRRMVFEQRVSSKGIAFQRPAEWMFDIQLERVRIALQLFGKPEAVEEANELAKALTGRMRKLAKPSAQEKLAAKLIEKELRSKKSGIVQARDIGTPTDVFHVQHLGADGHGRIVKLDNSDNPEFRSMLTLMGLEYKEVIRIQRYRCMADNLAEACGIANTLGLLGQQQRATDDTSHLQKTALCCNPVKQPQSSPASGSSPPVLPPLSVSDEPPSRQDELASHSSSPDETWPDSQFSHGSFVTRASPSVKSLSSATETPPPEPPPLSTLPDEPPWADDEEAATLDVFRNSAESIEFVQGVAVS